MIARILLIASSLAWGSAVFACSCITPPPPDRQFQKASIVFVGTVRDVESSRSLLPRFWFSLKLLVGNTDISGDTYCRNYGKRITFEVVDAWKGVSSRRVVLLTGGGGGDCGYPFKVARTYVVYSHSSPDDSCQVSLCSRTREIDDAADDLAFLRTQKRLEL